MCFRSKNNLMFGALEKFKINITKTYVKNILKTSILQMCCCWSGKNHYFQISTQQNTEIIFILFLQELEAVWDYADSSPKSREMWGCLLIHIRVLIPKVISTFKGQSHQILDYIFGSMKLIQFFLYTSCLQKPIHIATSDLSIPFGDRTSGFLDPLGINSCYHRRMIS